MADSSKDTRRDLRLTNRVLTSQDTLMKGIASPRYLAQLLRALDVHMFPRVIGSNGFVPVPKN